MNVLDPTLLKCVRAYIWLDSRVYNPCGPGIDADEVAPLTPRHAQQMAWRASLTDYIGRMNAWGLVRWLGCWHRHKVNGPTMLTVLRPNWQRIRMDARDCLTLCNHYPAALFD